MKAKKITTKDIKKEIKNLKKESEQKIKTDHLIINTMEGMLATIDGITEEITQQMIEDVTNIVKEKKKEIVSLYYDVCSQIVEAVIAINTEGCTKGYRVDIDLTVDERLTNLRSFRNFFIVAMEDTANDLQRKFGKYSLEKDERLYIHNIWMDDCEVGRLVSYDGERWEFDVKY